MTIIDGADTPEEEIRESEDSLESRLIVRLHCRLGVIKTHRLLLNVPSSDEAPVMRDDLYESRLVVQAQIVKEMIEHFPNARGTKNDPELVWTFDEAEVKVKSVDKSYEKGIYINMFSWADKLLETDRLLSLGRSQIASELSLSGEEFDRYDISLSPVTIAFFLREFYVCVVSHIVLDNASIDCFSSRLQSCLPML